MKKSKRNDIPDIAIILFYSIVSVAAGAATIYIPRGIYTNFLAGGCLFFALSVVWLIAGYRAERRVKLIETEDGYKVVVGRLSGFQQLIFAILAVLILIPMGNEVAKHSRWFNKDGETNSTENSKRKPHNNFRLLILPLHRECEYNGKQYDIGFVIAERLKSMAIKDSLHISLRYEDDISENSYLDRDSAYRLMRSYQADQILYGSYSLSECEGGSSDKVCFMYQVDPKNWHLPQEFLQHDEYKMEPFHGLEDIRYGAGQENIDYIIYWVAGISEVRQKKYARAIQLFQKIKGYSNKEAVLMQISVCYNLLKDYRNSQNVLQQVLKLNPRHEEANLHYAMQLVYEGKMEMARKKMEELQVQNPDKTDLLSHLSYIYKKLGDSVRTKMYMDRFLSLTPPTDSNAKDLSKYFEQMGYYAKAKESYQQGLKVCDKHADDWNNIGRIHIRLCDSVNAKSFFVHALEIDPNSAVALYYLAMLYNREKNYATAEQYLERAYQTDSLNTGLLVELGKAYDGLKKTDAALKKYEQVLSLNPRHKVAMFYASIIYMSKGEFEKANAYLDRTMKNFKYDTKLYNVIANMCADKGNYSQARLYNERMLKEMPGNGAVLYNLASVSAYQQRRTVALDYLSKALTALPALKDIARKDKAFESMSHEKKFIDLIK